MRACVGNEKEKERVGQKQTNDAQKKNRKKQTAQKHKNREQRADRRQKAEAGWGSNKGRAGRDYTGGLWRKRKKGGREAMGGSIAAGACTWLKEK